MKTLLLSTLAFATACACAQSPSAPAAPPGDDPQAMWRVTTVQGDTLIGLARQWLTDPGAWRELARVNRLPNPNRIGIGRSLLIPLRLLRTEPAPTELLRVVGPAVDGDARPLQAGQTLPEGAELRTGDDAHVTLRLVDGSLLRLRPGSRLQLSESRRITRTTATRAGVKLEQGRVEVDAAPAPVGRPGFRVDTPQGVMGVRGTEFRVAADTAAAVSRSEVLGGVVAVDSRSGAPGQRVGAGFGTVVDAAGRVAPPVALLPPPDVSGLPVLQEQILMRFTLPPLPGVAAWRGQVARDADFQQVLADLTTPGNELRFAGLADGDYLLRLRGIDAQGLEGRDADLRFRLKARPEAPLPSAPQPRAVVVGDRVEFGWAANSEAQRYRLQLATDPSLAQPLHDLRDLTALRAEIGGLVPGAYHWRLASVRDDAQGRPDQGPWGSVRSFEIKPPPPVPAPPAVGDQGVRFSWEGRPGQRFDFELARDERFADLVLQRQLDQPDIALPLPGVGRFYVRLRALEPDGFVGPWATTQYFDVPSCLRDTAGACMRSAGVPVNVTR